ncbi:MAG: hypothetical protein ACMXYB_03005 [Candidatus Woesearchaeota archaeon]
MNDKITVSKNQLRELVKELVQEEFSSNNQFLNFRGYEKLDEFEEKEIKKILSEDELVKFEL